MAKKTAKARGAKAPLAPKKRVQPLLSLRESEKRFLLKFFSIFFALFLLLKLADAAPIVSNAAGAAKETVAATEQFLLQSSGFQISRTGATLFNQGGQYDIIIECTGLVLVILLISLLYSTDVKKQRKRRALLLYTPFLLVFNVARLYATLWTGMAIGTQAMDVVHPLLWIVDSLLVLFLWSRAAEIKL